MPFKLSAYCAPLLATLLIASAAHTSAQPLLVGNTVLSTNGSDPCFRFDGAKPSPDKGCNVYLDCQNGLGSFRYCPAGMAAGAESCEFASVPCANITDSPSNATFVEEPAAALLPVYGNPAAGPGVVISKYASLGYQYLQNVTNMVVRHGDAYLFGGNDARASLASGATAGSLTYRLPGPVGTANLKVWVFASDGFRLTVSGDNTTAIEMYAHNPAPGVNLTQTSTPTSATVYFGANGNAQVWILHDILVYAPDLTETLTIMLEVGPGNEGEDWKVQLGQLVLDSAAVGPNNAPNATALFGKGVSSHAASASSGRRRLQSDKIGCFQTDSYGRGVGEVPTSGCPANQDLDAGLCYDKCADGYKGVGPVCWQTCSGDSTDIGAICSRPAQTIESNHGGCPWYDVCGLTFARGCSSCPGDYTWLGCTCSKGDTSSAKDSYGRGVGVPQSCPAGYEKDAGLCYKTCAAGFKGVGPVCWPDTCANPKFPNQCGSPALCTTTAATCSQAAFDIGNVAIQAVAAAGACKNDLAGCTRAQKDLGAAQLKVLDDIGANCGTA